MAYRPRGRGSKVKTSFTSVHAYSKHTPPHFFSFFSLCSWTRIVCVSRVLKTNDGDGNKRTARATEHNTHVHLAWAKITEVCGRRASSCSQHVCDGPSQEVRERDSARPKMPPHRRRWNWLLMVIVAVFSPCPHTFRGNGNERYLEKGQLDELASIGTQF